MRVLPIAIAALLVAACGTQQAPAQQPTFGTVTGHVLGYPCAPVQRIGASPCAGRPAAHVEVDFRLGSASPVRGITNTDGAYAVQLAPGTYDVSVSALRVLNGPKTVKVTAGKTVTVDFVFDTGIR
jgi:carboxypeptidase family protein